MMIANHERQADVVRAPFVLVPQHFGSIVFDRSTSRYLPFDAEATALLLRLRTESFERLLADVDDPRARDRHIRFFERFHRLGFFSLDGRFVGAPLHVRPPPDQLVGPLAVHLEVSASCNLTCAHCFAGELPRKEQALTMKELDVLFATLASMGTFRLGLTGGEPLLRRDVFEILDLATSHGLHPCLTTNGLLMTEETAREFGKRELVWLNVSVDGATARTNDRIRGEGAFARLMERVALLSRHARFTLAFTIMRSNLDEIRRFVELARRVGAHAAVFRPLYPVGSARRHLDLMPTFDEYEDALKAIARMTDDGDYDLHALDPLCARGGADSPPAESGARHCGAGTRVCSISVGGDVNPCSFLGPEHVAGNIRERPFADIWHASSGFREMRTVRGAAEQWNGTHGASFQGCRARALAYNGSVHAPDPWIA